MFFTLNRCTLQLNMLETHLRPAHRVTHGSRCERQNRCMFRGTGNGSASTRIMPHTSGSVRLNPATGVADRFEIATQAAGLLLGARRTDDEAVINTLVAKICILHVRCLAAQLRCVFLLQIRELLQGIHPA